MSWQEYPRLPWVQFRPAENGGFYVKDTRHPGIFHVPSEADVHAFAADHSKGLGTAIHNVTKTMGIPRCGACAKRQAAMNGGGLGAVLRGLFR